MKRNTALWDQILRMAAGVFLVAWATAGGPAWAFLGAGLIASASWGFCPFYAVFKTGTRAPDSPVSTDRV